MYQDVYKFEIVVENGVTVPPRGERRISGVGESFYVVLKLAENLDQGLHNFFFFYFFLLLLFVLYLFRFHKNTKIQNTFINIILHKKFMKLEEKEYI